MRVAACVVVGAEDSKWCGERSQKYERSRGRSCGVRVAACVVVGEEDSKWCSARLQKYEDSRWWLLCVEALLKRLQKYAVWSWWLLCDEALVEGVDFSSGRGSPIKSRACL